MVHAEFLGLMMDVEHASPPAAALLRAGHPLVGPLDDLEGEVPLAERADDEPAPRVGGIGLGVARRTERHQAVGIDCSRVRENTLFFSYL